MVRLSALLALSNAFLRELGSSLVTAGAAQHAQRLAIAARGHPLLSVAQASAAVSMPFSGLAARNRPGTVVVQAAQTGLPSTRPHAWLKRADQQRREQEARLAQDSPPGTFAPAGTNGAEQTIGMPPPLHPGSAPTKLGLPRLQPQLQPALGPAAPAATPAGNGAARPAFAGPPLVPAINLQAAPSVAPATTPAPHVVPAAAPQAGLRSPAPWDNADAGAHLNGRTTQGAAPVGPPAYATVSPLPAPPAPAMVPPFAPAAPAAFEAAPAAACIGLSPATSTAPVVAAVVGDAAALGDAASTVEAAPVVKKRTRRTKSDAVAADVAADGKTAKPKRVERLCKAAAAPSDQAADGGASDAVASAGAEASGAATEAPPAAKPKRTWLATKGRQAAPAAGAVDDAAAAAPTANLPAGDAFDPAAAAAAPSATPVRRRRKLAAAPADGAPVEAAAAAGPPSASPPPPAEPAPYVPALQQGVLPRVGPDGRPLGPLMSAVPEDICVVDTVEAAREVRWVTPCLTA